MLIKTSDKEDLRMSDYIYIRTDGALRLLSRSLLLFALLALIIILFPGAASALTGNGTAVDPYRISTADDLAEFRDIVNGGDDDAWGVLTQDIDLSQLSNKTERENWTPIGGESDRYIGTFDGKDKTITGLTVTGSDQYVGLFGHIGSGGTVKDVTLEEVKIESNNDMSAVGGVAGRSYGTLENCSVSGSVSVSGTNSIAGGVVGYQTGGSITGCSSSATVNAGGVAGGVAGLTDSGATLTACYATGDVTLESINSGGSFAGGVVGDNTNRSTVIACYAWGSVTGSGSGIIYVGGVTGENNIGSTLTACYHAKGAVSGPDGTTGGVAGRNHKDPMFGGGIITACYWGGNGQEQGIGEDQAGTTGGTEQVTDGDWQNAVTQMNAALSGKGWQYELKDGNSLPTLKKQ